jgi:hypothetical protein
MLLWESMFGDGIPSCGFLQNDLTCCRELPFYTIEARGAAVHVCTSPGELAFFDVVMSSDT